MHVPLLTALAGAGIGSGIAYYQSPEEYRRDVVPFGATSGALIGYKLGSWGQFITSWLRKRKLDKVMGEYPDATKKALMALLSDKRFKSVPVFQQTEGKPIDNAFYSPSKPDGSLVGDRGWKNLRTGKQVKDYDEFPERAVYIGSNYSKLPVIAHELGHAHDLRDSGFLSNVAPAMLLGVSFGSAMMSGLLLSDAADNGESPMPAMASLGTSVLSDALAWHLIRRKERAASDIAIQSLVKLPKKKRDEARDLLQRAYATYDPVQISQPDFGSGRYGELQPA